MRDFRGLGVWQKAHQVVLDVYLCTQAFPRDEIYGLTSQMRRAATSVAANIAEGCGRDGEAELARFVRMAMGSASELEYHVLLARDLGYLENQEYAKVTSAVQEVKRMGTGFVSRLRGSPGPVEADC